MLYALAEVPSKSGGRVAISVSLAEGEDGSPLRDLVNLYAFRRRRAFAQLVAEAFAREASAVLGALNLLLDHVERAQTRTQPTGQAALTKGRRRAAERLLERADLLDRAAKALEGLGVVGEGRAKRLLFLVAVSRLLPKPLSAILIAPLSSGKSELLERVSELVPPESLEFLSRLTPHALYYAGADHLRHKLVVVEEQKGASEADYPIRTLQSRGVLRMTTTLKGKAHSFETFGPIALLSSTTRSDLNAENLSRCLELPLDDSLAQTERVLEAQRQAWAGKRRRPVNVELWRDAQRLLEPLEVVIPFAPQLTYPARTSRDRREHAKLGSLIQAHALLHQRQRERDPHGRLVATVEDYEAVHALLASLLDDQLDELSARASRLYRWLAEEAELPSVTRRDVKEALGWSLSTARRALDELVRHELLKAQSGSKPIHYELLTRSLLHGGVGLTAPDELEG
ncbi:MAG TPA: hypothetical protein DEA08_34935 [Planctomycetes bacterium]|nr:hypothetical protein [Planctomycetota bacterium]